MGPTRWPIFAFVDRREGEQPAQLTAVTRNRADGPFHGSASPIDAYLVCFSVRQAVQTSSPHLPARLSVQTGKTHCTLSLNQRLGVPAVGEIEASAVSQVEASPVGQVGPSAVGQFGTIYAARLAHQPSAALVHQLSAQLVPQPSAMFWCISCPSAHGLYHLHGSGLTSSPHTQTFMLSNKTILFRKLHLGAHLWLGEPSCSRA